MVESQGWAPDHSSDPYPDHIGAVDAVNRYGIPLYASSGVRLLNQPELNLSAYWGQPFTARPAEVLWEDLGDRKWRVSLQSGLCAGRSPGHVAYILLRTISCYPAIPSSLSIGRTDLPDGSTLN